MDSQTEETKDPYEKPETDEHARMWGGRVSAARKHWEKFHKRVKHNRKVVAGFDWGKDPAEKGFYKPRANLIHGTITAILPNIYARNPEMSVTPQHKGRNLKLMCETVRDVTNRQLEDADLKNRAKSSVRAALTCSFGVCKVTYQRDIKEDPIIKDRIQDTQDNIQHIEGLMTQLDDPNARGEQEAIKAELQQTLAALNEQVEVTAAEGLVIDRVLTEYWLPDPAIAEFWDYKDCDYQIQLIPMKKRAAEDQYKVRLAGAKTFSHSIDQRGEEQSSGKVFSGGDGKEDDSLIFVCEIWDRVSQRVYTMVEGCDFFVREPYSPKRVGSRWYPFFVLPFQLVDGQVIAPSLVDLTERLQEEHNSTRDKENDHRNLIKPGWIAGGDVSVKTITRYTDAEIGEITIVDTQGKPLNGFIQPKQHPAIDPAVYDTSKVRYDWEQVTGMQDAARSSMVSAKTATEASIMQQSLSGRVSEFRDQVEDYLQEISQYAAQILLMELTDKQVERIMGAHITGPIAGPDGNPLLDPANGQPVIGVIEPAYDWPQLSREEVFDLVKLQIRAGTTGEPDKMEQQEVWIKLMPVIQPLIVQIMDFQLKGIPPDALIVLLKETVARFDDKLDVEQLIPKVQPLPPPPQMMPGQGAMPPVAAAQ